MRGGTIQVISMFFFLSFCFNKWLFPSIDVTQSRGTSGGSGLPVVSEQRLNAGELGGLGVADRTSQLDIVLRRTRTTLTGLGTVFLLNTPQALSTWIRHSRSWAARSHANPHGRQSAHPPRLADGTKGHSITNYERLTTVTATAAGPGAGFTAGQYSTTGGVRTSGPTTAGESQRPLSSIGAIEGALGAKPPQTLQ